MHISVLFSVLDNIGHLQKQKKKQITDKKNIRCLIGLDYFKN